MEVSEMPGLHTEYITAGKQLIPLTAFMTCSSTPKAVK